MEEKTKKPKGKFWESLRRVFNALTFRSYLNTVQEAEVLRESLDYFERRILQAMIFNARKTKKSDELRDTMDWLWYRREWSAELEQLYKAVADGKRKADDVKGNIALLSQKLSDLDDRLTRKATSVS